MNNKQLSIGKKLSLKHPKEVINLKFGMRKPSIKKSISARTTGRAKRTIKKALIPGYGKKGMGWIKNPRKALYNKVYRKTTFSFWDLFK
jgi:hypothetical protein